MAFMGVAFLLTALRLGPEPAALARGTLWPRLPPGSPLLVMGLIGTTVVPYNLFLGSGIARGQKLGALRFGLTVAIVLGGVISMAVLVVGTTVDPPLAFDTVGEALRKRLGGWADALFAFGLLAAGLSSAITAPLAAAVAARSLWPRPADAEGSEERTWRYRSVWLLVLLTGVGFGLAEVQPIPAIILAQVLNGILLPFVAVFLLLLVNDGRLMGREGLNGALSNTAMGLVVAVTVLLGLLGVSKAVASLAGLPVPGESRLLASAGLLVVALAWPVARAVRARRRAV